MDPAEAGPRPPSVAKATGTRARHHGQIPAEGSLQRDPSGPRAVLWDLDGTLVDSAEQHWESWREVLAAGGVSVTHEQFRAAFGRRNDEYLPDWLGPGATREDVRRIGEAKEARFRELVEATRLTPLPGGAEWVRRLAQDGWRQAVASSAPRLNVEVVVRALGLLDYFGALLAAEDVTHGKPAPDVFLAAAGRLGVPPARCVVVEDAAAGIEAARRAGMRSVGIGAPGFAPADVVLRSLDLLPLDAFERLIESRRGSP
jgi:beta-phosphoglucomutase